MSNNLPCALHNSVLAIMHACVISSLLGLPPTLPSNPLSKNLKEIAGVAFHAHMNTSPTIKGTLIIGIIALQRDLFFYQVFNIFLEVTTQLL